MTNFTDDHNCFVCGLNNPSGLKLRFRKNETQQTVETDVMFPAHLQSWKDVVHGGLLATVLDEVMVQASMLTGRTYVTGELTVRYKKPVKPETPYMAQGKVTQVHGRIIQAEGCIRDQAGHIYAEATSKLVKVG